MGKVRFFGVGTVGARWKKACETANVMVYYTKKDTGGLLNGELAARNCGADEWWLLLDPVAGQ